MLIVLLSACVDSEPAFVSERDLDKAFGTGDTPSLCAGLRMEEPKTREAAAEKLKDYGLDSSCLCDRLKYDDRWDLSILQGLADAEDAAKVGCVATLLDDPTAPERAELVKALNRIPAVKDRVRAAAASDTDPAVRAAAINVYRNTKVEAERKLLEGWLASDPDAGIRAAAANALFDQPAAKAAIEAAVKDTDPVVRGAALRALPTAKSENFATVVCDALMTDTAPEVRLAALEAVKATRDPAVLACLEKRALTEETDATVRAALLKTLSTNGSKQASDTLCTIIPSWVKMYVTEKLPEEAEDVLKAQNSRDFERSYDCAAAASKQGGSYTCIGRMYVNTFYRDVGGKVGVPNCGGGGSSGGASNEIVF